MNDIQGQTPHNQSGKDDNNNKDDKNVKRVSSGQTSQDVNIMSKNTSIKKWTPDICDQLQRNKSLDILEVIEFNDCKLTDVEAEKLQNLLFHGIPHLRKLKLQNNRLGDKGIQLICRGIKKCNINYDSLTYINISNNHVTVLGIEKIVKLIIFLNGSITVDIDYNEIGYQGLNKFIDSKFWESLTIKHLLNLDTRRDIYKLDQNPFSISPYKMLFLKHLSFEENNLNPSDVTSIVGLFQNLPLGSLQVLKFINETINDLGFLYITNMMIFAFLYTLKVLCIKNTYITLDGVITFLKDIYMKGGSNQLYRFIYHGFTKGTDNDKNILLKTPPSEIRSKDLPYCELDCIFVHNKQFLDIQSITVKFIHNLLSEDYVRFIDTLCKNNFNITLQYIKLEGEKEWIHIDWLLNKYISQKFINLKTIYLSNIYINSSFFEQLFKLKYKQNSIELLSIENAKKSQDEPLIDLRLLFSQYPTSTTASASIVPLNENTNASLKFQTNSTVKKQMSQLDADYIDGKYDIDRSKPLDYKQSFETIKIFINKYLNHFTTNFNSINMSEMKLKYLNLKNCQINDYDLYYVILNIFTTTSLEIVDLEHNNISNDGFDLVYNTYCYITDYFAKNNITIQSNINNDNNNSTIGINNNNYISPKIPIIHIENNTYVEMTDDRLKASQIMTEPVHFDIEDIKPRRCFCH